MSEHLGKSTLGGGIVHVYVGKENTQLDVHLELLRSCSPYFDNLLKGRGIKDVTQHPIRFPDDDPDLFVKAICWMYRSSLPHSLSCDSQQSLYQLWVLAGKLQIPELQNNVMRLCKEKIDQSPRKIVPNNSIDYIYSHTVHASPLRRWAVDVWVRRVTASEFMSRKEVFPRAFLEDMCCALLMKNKNSGAVDDDDADFERRYFVHPTPLTDRNGDGLPPRPRGEPELATRATPAQMENRTVKSPVSRMTRASPRSNSGSPTLVPPSPYSDSQSEEADEEKVKKEVA